MKRHTAEQIIPKLRQAEADLAQGKLSSESPVARALLGRAPGEAVPVKTPRGTRSYRVKKLVP